MNLTWKLTGFSTSPFWKVHEPDGYAGILAEFFVTAIWICMLNSAYFIVMPYLYVFIYVPDMVQKGQTTGFPSNVAP